jgi:Type VI secretion system/phage-baseplate injector OB domain
VRRIDGVAIGLVVEVDAKLGRVRVSFPWMEPAQESYWAPIAAPLAGKKRGVRFMPEIGDETLIAFDRGEFDHPYVVGFLWNGVDEAPDDVVTNRIIVTPGGHELRFEDKDGDKRVVIRTAGAHRVALDDKAKSITVESTQGHKLEILDGEGTVALATKRGGHVRLGNVPGTAVVEASQNKVSLGPGGITIEIATGTLNITASATTTINAAGPLTVKTSAPMEIESAAAINIRSAGVMSVTAAVVNVSAGLTTVAGALQAGTIMAGTVIATSVVSSSYSPGAGNLI